jgi:iron complex transport system permease protein
MLLLLAAVLLLVFLASFALGRYGVPVGEVVRILIDRVVPLENTWTPQMETAVVNVRLPRILIACLVGCSLSAAGAAYQGVFQNPMASPDILGASSGAAFGAALAILFGASSRMVTVSAFLFSIITVLLVFLIASRAPGLRVVNLILAGIMIGSLFSAGTSYIKLVADPSNQLPAITYWLMGSLSGSKLQTVVYAFAPMALGLIPLFLLRWRINILTLGDEEARALGVNTNVLRMIVIVCSTLVTAASISVGGMIGWVGLVIPHLARKLVGSNYRYLIPASMLAGAAFLLLVDDVSRNLLAVEIPIGILTAFIGAPFFIYLICRREKTL